MLELYRDDFLLRIFGHFLQVLFSAKLDCALRNLQTTTNVTTVHRNFARDEVKSFLVDDVINVQKSLLKNDLDLVKIVRLIDQTIITDT